MRWKFYWRDIVKKYLVKIAGWPSDIPFGNLGDIAMSLPILERLQRLWNDGTIHFEAITEGEFTKLDEERYRQIEHGEINAPMP